MMFQITLDALIANQGELKRLKPHILSCPISTSSSKEYEASADVIPIPSHLHQASADLTISTPSESSSFSSSSSLLNQQTNDRLKQHAQKYLPKTTIVCDPISEADKIIDPRGNNPCINHPVVFPVSASIPLSASNRINDYSIRKVANVKIVPAVDIISVETFRYEKHFRTYIS